MYKQGLVALLLIASGTAVYAQLAVAKELKADSFKDKLEAYHGEAVLLDVRTPQEVSQGYIEGAKNIDFKADDFRSNITGLDKNKTYFVYCASGVRSGNASLVMVEMGFKSIYTLRGGLKAWIEEDLPLVKKE